MTKINLDDLLDCRDERIYEIRTRAPGPSGSLPLTHEALLNWPSGHLFGWTQDAAMGWNPRELGRPEILLLSTQGGLRAPDGAPLALGYHVGHWEVGLLVEAAARELTRLGAVPFAGFLTDPCDGRTQGTTGMFDSLAYRNDAAAIFRRLIRSLPTRRGVIGVATCDKALPAMMMALAACPELPCVLIPGGVTLPPEEGEDAGTIQSAGARYAHAEITLQQAALYGCRACASSGGGCQFLGTAASSQVVGEALGLTLPHAALSPSGQPVWLDLARRSARAVLALEERGLRTRDILTDASLRNAMMVHCAFGGSTNLVLHLPAIAHAAGLARPTRADWAQTSRRVPRLVDALPNGPRNHPTVRVFLAGGVPEVMLHLSRAGLLETGVLTVTGETLGRVLAWWERSERRTRLRALLKQRDGVDPDEVIMDPAAAARRGLTPTVAILEGNLAPEGALVKSTAIDPGLAGPDGVYRHRGPARVFTREADAVAAIKSRGPDRVRPGDVIVLIGRGPMGAGMEEILQVTGALRHLEFGRHIAVLTDARFSGVSTGPCVGHIAPEALAGGPIGRLREGDLIEIIIDRLRLEGSVDLVGIRQDYFGPEEGRRLLAARSPHPDLRPDPDLPADTRLWAALQRISGGSWGGAVFDVERILRTLEAGRRALAASGDH